MSLKIKPLNDRVLIKKIQTEETSSGGIIIPSDENKVSQNGVVIAIGEGRRTDQGILIEPTVKIGDTVFFTKYTGTEAGDGHIIVRENEILAIISN